MRDETTPLSPEEIARISRRIQRPIALIGLMGVGKSTVGKRLAGLLEVDFVDADQEIEEAAQLSIPEIFTQFGEQYFRDGERRVIARLMEEHSGVVATGGGAFMDEETRRLILERGIAVWIDCDLATLVERTGRKNNRPLLHGGDPATILARLKAERDPVYAMAPVHVSSANGPHTNTACAILKAIDQWL